MNAILMFVLISTLVASPLPVPSLQTSAFRGDTITLTVQLRSQGGFPIENASVLFFHETQDTYLGSAITNATGHAQFIWSIPLSHVLGPIQLNATFRGDPARYLLPSMVPIPLTIFAQLQNHFNITDANGVPIGSQVQIGQQLLFHTQVTDDNMTPMEDVSVQLILEPNEILAERQTPQNGSLTLSCTLNQTANHIATFRIRSLSQGYYNGTDSVVQLQIEKASVSFVGVPSYWVPSNGYSLGGRLITTTGLGIPNASIELRLDSGHTLSFSRSNNDGLFNFDLFAFVESIQARQYIVLRYNGTIGFGEARVLVGIITSPPYLPYTLEPITSTAWLSALHQISIISLSCLTIGSSILTLRMKRSTKRIVSH
jgi:hypothetical protein